MALWNRYCHLIPELTEVITTEENEWLIIKRSGNSVNSSCAMTSATPRISAGLAYLGWQKTLPLPSHSAVPCWGGPLHHRRPSQKGGTEGIRVVLLLWSKGCLFIYLFSQYFPDTQCASLYKTHLMKISKTQFWPTGAGRGGEWDRRMTEFCGPVSSNRGLSKVFRESPGRYVSFCLGEPGKASEVTARFCSRGCFQPRARNEV